jgi:hypothetical protein
MFPPANGLKFYPDQPNITDAEAAGGLVGTRVDSVAVVPTEAGHWQIPELRIPWWDTDSNELRYAVLPARELDVTGGSPAAPTQAPAPLPAPEIVLQPGAVANIPIVENAGSPWWPIIALVNGAGWLLTLVYLAWSRARRGRPAQAGTDDRREPTVFKTLLHACSSGDAPLARKAVIEWTGALSAQTGLASLAQVSAVFDDPAMDAALDGLNAALYGNPDSPWNGTALAEAARRLRPAHRRAAGSPEAPLQLYPQAG